jgi:hypothetical protein
MLGTWRLAGATAPRSQFLTDSTWTPNLEATSCCIK